MPPSTHAVCSCLHPRRSWFQNFVQAADSIGFAVCASVALVSEDGSQVFQEQQLHTGQQQ